ncbi:unnamed protein product, partial [Coregonus sp. 'balchen']
MVAMGTRKTSTDRQKDNFNLRLRIFFYEELLQQRCDDSVEEMYKTNIDLKVEVVTLEEEMRELQSVSALALKNYPDQMEQLREYGNTKIQLLEKDLDSSRVKVGKVTAMLEQERMRCLELVTELQGEGHSQSDAPNQTDPLPQDQNPDQNLEQYQDLLSLLEERDRLIEQLQASVKSQEVLIDQLRNSGAGQGSGDQPTADPNRQLSYLITQREMDLQALKQDHGREKRKYDRHLKELRDMMAEKDFQLAECEFKAYLQEKEKELLTLNNLLFSHEDTIHTLENELANEKIKYDSKMKELQDALEQSNKEMSEKDFLLTENEIKLKELEATVKTLNCSMPEKYKLPQRAKDEILTAIKGKGNYSSSKLSLLLQKLTDLQDRNDQLSCCQHLINSVGALTPEREVEMDQTRGVFERLQGTKQELEKSLSQTLQDKDKAIAHLQDALDTKDKDIESLESVMKGLDQELQEKNFIISQLQEVVNRKSEIMVGRLHSQTEDSNKELEKLEQRLKETEAILVQTTQEKETQLTDHQLEIEKLQGEAEDSNRKLEQLEEKLKETEDILAQTSDKQLQDNQLTDRKLQGQVEDSDRKVEQLEQRLKETDILAQTIDDKDKLLIENQLAERKLQSYTEDSSRKLGQLDQMLKEKDVLFMQNTADKARQLTNYKLTVEKFMSYITTLRQGCQKQIYIFSLKKLREHHSQILAKHTLELKDYGKEAGAAIHSTDSVPPAKAGPTRCERCLQLLQQENGSLLDRLRASERLNKTLHSQLDLCRAIMAQREGGDGCSFTPSTSLTMEEGMEEQQQEILRLEEITQANGRLHEQLENHRAQQAAAQTGAQEAGTEMRQNHPERLNEAVVESGARESGALREERERLTEGSLEGSLSSTRKEIDRLKGEIDAYQKQLTNCHELLKSLCVEMQGSKQMRTAAVNATATEFGGGLQDNPKLNQLLSEIQQIRGQLADKDTTQTKATEEKLPEHSGWPECRPKIINYVACGASRHSNRSSPSGRRDHAKKDNLSQSSHYSSMDDSATSLLNSSLSQLWVYDKSPHSDSVNNNQSQEDLYWENLKLKNKIERMRREQSQNKKMLSEAVKRLRRVNRRKVERL